MIFWVELGFLAALMLLVLSQLSELNKHVGLAIMYSVAASFVGLYTLVRLIL